MQQVMEMFLKMPYIIAGRQAVHLHKSTFWVQNKLCAHQHIFGALVSWTPQLEQSLEESFSEVTFRTEVKAVH